MNNSPMHQPAGAATAGSHTAVPGNGIAYETTSAPTFLNRINWSAVIAGAILTVAAFILLNLLGTAIGAGTVNPLTQANPFDGLGKATAIWLLVSSVIALAVGGFVAGRYAPQGGGMHGLLSWAVVTMISAYMISSFVSTAVTTAGKAAGSVISAGAQVTGAGVAAAAPKLKDQVQAKLDQNGISPDWNGLKGQLDTLLMQTGKPELQPANVNAEVGEAKDNTAESAKQAAQTPQGSGNELQAWMDRIKEQAQPMLAAADVDALANIIAARTGKPKAEAQQIAQNYAQSYQTAMAKYNEMKQEAEQKARKAGEAAASAITMGAWATLGFLLLGAVVSYFMAVWGHERAITAVTTRPVHHV